MEREHEQLIHISFNQDQTYFAVGTQKGFKIYKLDQEVVEEISREFGAGIGIIEMVHKTNIFALVGGGKIPRYPRNKLVIWDDCKPNFNAAQMKPIVETSCKSEVKAVKMKQDRCILVLETKIFVFNLSDFRLLSTLETCLNPGGLCTISTLKEPMYLAFPSKKIGFVEIFSDNNSNCRQFQAHRSVLNALQMCPNGYKIATASEKGTLIRVFDIGTCQCIQELRRGSEYANIYSISFDITSRWLSCSSDSGTIHIFALRNSSLEQAEKETEFKNKKSKLAILSKLSSYFDSEWSIASYRTGEEKTKVSFLNKGSTLVVVSTKGIIHIIQFNPEKGGDCNKVAQYDLFQRNG